MSTEDRDRIADYWKTEIIDIEPGSIRVRGYPIQQLIGEVSFATTIWLMLRGELPAPAQTKLFEAVLVSSVDHGPHAPSIAIARMAVTCGLPLNGAIASAVNVLDDVHGGAGAQAAEMFTQAAELIREGIPLQAAANDAIDFQIASAGKFLPGYGHRFHTTDPRSVRLAQLIDEAAKDGIIDGTFGSIALAIEAALEQRKGRRIPLNVDGASAALCLELGFPPALIRGIFCLSRSVGILAHAWEQSQSPIRNKGPIPRDFAYRFTGKAQRTL